MFYRSQTPIEQRHLIEAVAFDIGRVFDPRIRQRAVDSILAHIDLNLARQVAIAVDATPPEKEGEFYRIPPALSPALSLSSRNPEPTISTRRVAFLVADGYDSAALLETRAALKAAGAVTIVVGPRVGAIRLEGKDQPPTSKADSDTSLTRAEFSYETVRSTLFDAVVIIGGKAAVQTMMRHGRVSFFVIEAIKHFKPVLAVGDAVNILSSAPVGPILAASGIKIATANDKENVISDNGIISVFEYKSVGSSDNSASGLSGALRSAMSSVTGSSSSNPQSAPVSSGVGTFIEAMKLHRIWNRDVSLIPA